MDLEEVASCVRPARCFQQRFLRAIVQPLEAHSLRPAGSRGSHSDAPVAARLCDRASSGTALPADRCPGRLIIANIGSQSSSCRFPRAWRQYRDRCPIGVQLGCVHHVRPSASVNGAMKWLSVPTHSACVERYSSTPNEHRSGSVGTAVSGRNSRRPPRERAVGGQRRRARTAAPARSLEPGARRTCSCTSGARAGAPSNAPVHTPAPRRRLRRSHAARRRTVGSCTLSGASSSSRRRLVTSPREACANITAGTAKKEFGLCGS